METKVNTTDATTEKTILITNGIKMSSVLHETIEEIKSINVENDGAVTGTRNGFNFRKILNSIVIF